MLFAICMGGEVLIFGLIFLAVAAVFAGACIWAAVYATMALAKWAAARHNARLAASLR